MNNPSVCVCVCVSNRLLNNATVQPGGIKLLYYEEVNPEKSLLIAFAVSFVILCKVIANSLKII